MDVNVYRLLIFIYIQKPPKEIRKRETSSVCSAANDREESHLISSAVWSRFGRHHSHQSSSYFFFFVVPLSFFLYIVFYFIFIEERFFVRPFRSFYSATQTMLHHKTKQKKNSLDIYIQEYKDMHFISKNICILQ